MKVLYRISDNGYKKPKLPNATKQNCLHNFLVTWKPQEVTVFKDKVTPETDAWLTEWSEVGNLEVQTISEGGSSAGSWRFVAHWAMDNLPRSEVVYFVEDDYFHLEGSRKALLEAIERADYVTLYDAPDKYVPASMGGNPFIEEDGADPTRVILTPSRHWRITNSTTMTFACRVGTLVDDWAVWDKWTQPPHPHDFQAFLELREKGRTLLSPIPTLSTHCEPAWLAPLVDWSKV